MLANTILGVIDVISVPENPQAYMHIVIESITRLL